MFHRKDKNYIIYKSECAWMDGPDDQIKLRQRNLAPHFPHQSSISNRYFRFIIVLGKKFMIFNFYRRRLPNYFSCVQGEKTKPMNKLLRCAYGPGRQRHEYNRTIWVVDDLSYCGCQQEGCTLHTHTHYFNDASLTFDLLVLLKILLHLSFISFYSFVSFLQRRSISSIVIGGTEISNWTMQPACVRKISFLQIIAIACIYRLLYFGEPISFLVY